MRKTSWTLAAATTALVWGMASAWSWGVGALPVRSGFDAGLEGWTVPVSAEWRATGGNPGGMLYGSLDEPTNTTAVADAPARYLGDLSALDGIGVVLFDYRRFSRGGGTLLADLPTTISLSGAGGSAHWEGPTPHEPGDWFTVAAPLRLASWTVTSGTWAGLLANAGQMRIQIELESSTESPDDKAGLDNVVLTLLGDANLDGRVDADDFALTDRGFARGLGGWANGDFDLSGGVDATDYALVTQTFAVTHPGEPLPVAALSVPEPAGTIVAAGAIEAVVRARSRRRRRRH